MSEPVAYLITFRTYGSWLHGDGRGSVDREHKAYGTPLLAPHHGRERSARDRCAQAAFALDTKQRRIVHRTLTEVCRHRGWSIHALNVRTNHVHVVVSAPEPPERVMGSLKSWTTRRLREANLIASDTGPWSRHGSTRYLWNPGEVEHACEYIVEGQGDDA